jgi:hypothetical protein
MRCGNLAIAALIAACIGVIVFAAGFASAGVSGVEHVSQSAVNGNGDAVAEFAGISADGSRVFFTTVEQLAATDTDDRDDVYMREGGVTTQISRGVINGNGDFDSEFQGASSDGGRVFFSTRDQLAATDTDSATDLYMREGGTTTHISRGEINGNGPNAGDFRGSSTDGSRVFFTSGEHLTATDDDSGLTGVDVYMREGNTTTLISDRSPADFPGPDGDFLASFVGASADGARVFFTTDEQMDAFLDGDFHTKDVFKREGGVTTLISRSVPNANIPAEFDAVSLDGSRVLWQTAERVNNNATDTDNSVDLYLNDGSPLSSRVSVGSINGNQEINASFAGGSSDLGHLFFKTTEQLTPDDTDTSADIFERTGSVTARVTQGEINGNGAFDVGAITVASRDGGTFVFATNEPLVAADADSSADVYARAAGKTTLISQGQVNGNGAFDATPSGISADGSRVVFSTNEPLVPADTDAVQDLYLREAGVTTQISQGAINGNGPNVAGFEGATADAGRVFFGTSERLASTDLDLAPDVYVANVESVPPETTIDAGPPDGTTATDATFSYSSSEAGSSFECSLDGGSFSSCSAGGTSFSNLALGAHTFAVRATDHAHNTDPTPAEYSWAIQAGGGGGGGSGGGGGGGVSASCRGKPATIVGTEASERVRGTTRKDVIATLDGNDTVKAGGGNDVVCAGKGNDRVKGDDGNDKLFGEQGKDRLTGGEGRDLTNGGPGSDACNGGQAHDRGRACERGPES